MMAKIEWYQEILALEPGSKVFFPFAKCLVQEGEQAQAIEVLHKGLEQHPEYLEARIFLVQLLHEQGDLERCFADLDRLAALFSAYPGFWEAWSVANEGKSPDISLVLSYLAAAFRYQGVSLHQIFTFGLEALRTPKTLVQGGSVGAKTAADPTEVFLSSAPLDETGLNETGSSLNRSFQENAVPIPKNTGQGELFPGEAYRSDGQVVGCPLACPQMVSEGEVNETVKLTDVAEQDESVELPESARREPSDRLPKDPYQRLTALLVTPPVADMPIAPSRPDATELVSPLVAGGFDDAVDVDENVTVRTRSMAEVLAQQGDAVGAIEIYQELEAQAVTSDDVADLRRRIASLSGVGTSVLASSVGKNSTEDVSESKIVACSHAQQSDVSSNTSRIALKGVLENLAERLEARARA